MCFVFAPSIARRVYYVPNHSCAVHVGIRSFECQTLFVMSVITSVREYINKMLSEVPGMKALLLDRETVRGGWWQVGPHLSVH